VRQSSTPRRALCLLKQYEAEFPVSSLPQQIRQQQIDDGACTTSRGSSPTGEVGGAPATELLTSELDPPFLFSPLFLSVSSTAARGSPASTTARLLPWSAAQGRRQRRAPGRSSPSPPPSWREAVGHRPHWGTWWGRHR
jgi:hypothetical protein